MKISCILLLVFIVSMLFVDVSVGAGEFFGYGVRNVEQGRNLRRVVSAPLPDTPLPIGFDWRSVNGLNLLTPPRNQLMPKYCGSCWAFATTSVLSDRMKIMNKASKTDVLLSVQALVDCGRDASVGSCEGGDFMAAFSWIAGVGLTDETCAPYMGVDFAYSSELPCNETMCRQCDRFGNCYSLPNVTRYYTSEWAALPSRNTTAMMQEIYNRGPIACYVYAHSNSFEYYKSGIIVDPTVYPYITHAISIVGWGFESGVAYWIGKNSFGTTWGEHGWFKIGPIGANTLLIESACGWAMPSAQKAI